ncbi:hypothetical protein [Ancylobacter sp. TS-1]|uniref:hypothetical protein n=1 Tax=Ancylobacter sp. TS-1 TaxID=1850374 RepID=UPI001265C62B|nr:hypothetical protein [Ancylobacter sp. TS-1]QFR34721.1 hypothetical protein GBB76_17320 [Ancylobacter sp. TS-1]
MGSNYVEALVLARDLHKRVSGEMLTKPDGTVLVPVDLAPLMLLVKDEFGPQFEVDIARTPKLNKVFGHYLRYDSRVKIRIADRLNTCWTRLVICKEIMHLFCSNSEEHYSTDPIEQLKKALDRNEPSALDHELHDEDFALFAAMEYLYPWHLRIKLADMNGYDYLAVATKFRIPQIVVENYFITGYGSLSESAHQQL